MKVISTLLVPISSSVSKLSGDTIHFFKGLFIKMSEKSYMNEVFYSVLWEGEHSEEQKDE